MRTLVTVLLCTTLLMAGCGQGENPTENKEGGILGSSMTAMDLSSAEGSTLTQRKCASCHSLDRNIRKIGPSLKGIIGKVPTINGIPFKIWTEESIDKWIENPRSIKKKTGMAIPGIKDAEERRQIISYLKRL